jgi:integrase
MAKKGSGLLLLEQTLAQQKVIDFLNSIARNSVRSKDTYSIGLSHFQTFLCSRYGSGYTLANIVEKILTNEVNVYALLDNFVSYLISTGRLSTSTVRLHVAATRSYLQYHDIDISPAKFKRRVKIPKNHREDEEPIDAADMRKILLSCQNRRLKPYLLVLGTCGCRAIEALAVRCKDIDFTISPTKIHLRKEYTKTRVARDVYISNEATKFLKEWLEWKYRQRESGKETPVMHPEDLVFSKAKFGTEERQNNQANPQRIYQKISQEFNHLLKTVGMDERKDGMFRRKITFTSVRRLVKTVVSTQVSKDYSEWFLGHSKSSYWTMKEPVRREIYATKIMKYLTYLDYSELETTGKNIEAKLEEKDKELQILKKQVSENTAILNKFAEMIELGYKRDMFSIIGSKEMQSQDSKIKDIARDLEKKGIKAARRFY